jgi:hypothetical protein
MKWVIGAACLAAAGCAVQHETYLPDGSKGFSINCGGQALSWAQCYEKAGKTCGAHGYEIIGKEGESNPSATATSQLFIASANVQRTLLIKCK